MKQLTLTDAEHSGRKKTTRREEFLKSMDAIIQAQKQNAPLFIASLD